MVALHRAIHLLSLNINLIQLRMKKLFSGVLVILLLLITSCSAEMPEVVNPDSSPGTTHRFLSVKEVSNRLHGIWPTLPKSNPTTRNNDEPQVDSVFVLPGGQYVGTYNPTVGDLFADPNVQYIDTVSTYALVFTFKNEQGFIIMSAREGLPDMLYYAENGSFNSNDLKVSSNAGGFGVFMNLLDDYVECEYWADPEDGGGGSNTWWETDTVRAGGTGVPVKWDQVEPYNNQCPIIGGERALTGCVATAVAQIMAYYKYPASYEGYTFHWDDMINGIYYGHGYYDIPQLMAFLGTTENLHNSYGLSATGARFKHVPRTFQNFGYSYWGKQVKYKFGVFTNQIDRNMPVVICGYDKSDVGHAWVGDGYMTRKKKKGTKTIQTIQYIHCNWGWGGYRDGWAIAGVFDPRDTSSDPIIDTRSSNSDDLEEECDCDPYCGISSGLTSTSYYRRNHMIINIQP